MIIYNTYYRNYGVRKWETIVNPRKAPIQDLVLSRSAIYHYLPQSTSDIGPSNTEPVFRDVNRPVMLEFVTEPTSLVGNPRVRAVNVMDKVRDFFLKNRRYRRLRELRAVDNSLDIQVAMSYGLINAKLHYIVTKLSGYQQWLNVTATAWDRIAQLAQESNRHQFVPVHLPNNILPPATLNRFAEEMTIQGLSHFTTPDDFMLLELWRWIADYRKYSVISRVRPELLNKINILFIDRTSWFVVNLGLLNSWRQTSKKELEDSEQQVRSLEFATQNVDLNVDLVAARKLEAARSHLTSISNSAATAQPPLMLAKMFLRGLMSVVGTRTHTEDDVRRDFTSGGEPDGVEDTQAPDYATQSARQAQGTTKSTDGASEPSGSQHVDELEQTTFSALKRRQSLNTRLEDLVPDFDFDADEQTGDDALKERVEAISQSLVLNPDDQTAPANTERAFSDLEALLDEDFKVLEHIENKQLEREERLAESNNEANELAPLPEEKPFSLEPDERLMALCDEAVETGGMTGSDYRRFERLSEKYRSIVMPNGQTLDAFIKITPEDLEIKEPPKPENVGGVIDDGLINNRMQTFTKQYVEKLLDRDIASMVVAVQNGGVALTDLKIEDVADATGREKVYTGRLVPMEGEPTPFRFSIPVPDENGVFEVGGVPYRYRTQQEVSMPIKKVHEREVLLNSYYGKVFVRKPEFKVSNYQEWLCAQIRAADIQNKGISAVVSEPNLDPLWKCPLVFTYIGSEISAFKALYAGKHYDFNFQARGKAREAFMDKRAQSLETGGARVIAKSEDDDYLIITPDNNVTRVTPENLRVAAGTIETVLGFDLKRAPIEYTQLATMGQDIPVGVILGFYHGFTWLLRRFRPTFRRVKRGDRQLLQDYEYRVQFADEVFIFDRREVLNTLIFSGWNKYRGAVANYTYREFNDRRVYMNLFEDAGVSPRILGELRHLRNMFIDPMTAELLKSMNEPVEFDKLLVRATELLVDGYTPVVRDRIRGYERFAGVVYGEFVRAIRAHDNRYGRNRTRLDLNPLTINKAILTDPAKMMFTQINPVEDVKQQDAISVTGLGGRSSRALTQKDRVYDMERHSGVVSEATVDNDKVAVNASLSANPKILNLRGITEAFNPETDHVSSLVSLPMLLSPASEHDD